MNTSLLRDANEKGLFYLADNPDCKFPQNEWFTRLFSQSGSYRTFFCCIGDCTVVEIVMEQNCDLKVHITKYFEGAFGEIFPTEESVTLSCETFDSFQNQMKNFHFYSKKDSFVSNNEILTLYKDERSCVLQELIKSSNSDYSLKPKCVHLSKEQFLNLKNICDEINDNLIQTKLLKVIPICVLNRAKDCEHSHLDIEVSKIHFFSCFIRELKESVRREFDCNSCTMGYSYENFHECRKYSICQQFNLCSENALLNFNVQEFVNYLAEKCLCEFTHTFFACMDFNIYINHINTVFNM